MNESEKEYIETIPPPPQLEVHNSENLKVKMVQSKKLSIDSLSIRYDREGQYLAVGHKNGSKILLSTKDYKTVASCEDLRDNTITTLKWRPSGASNKGKVLVSGDAGGFITYLHVPSLKPLISIHEQQNSVHSIDFSPDSAWLVSGGKDARIRLYDEETKSLVRTYERAGWNTVGHDNRVFCVKFISQKVVISGGWDSVVHFWDTRQEKSIRHIYGPNISGESLDYADNTILAGCYSAQKQVQLWDIKMCKKIVQIDWTAGNIDDAEYIYAAAFAKTNSKLFGAGSTGANSEVRLYTRETETDCKLQSSIKGLMQGCLSMDFSERRQEVAFTTPHHGLYVYRYESRQ